MNITPMLLSEARTRYFKRVERGVRCPCCDRFGKIHNRPLNSNMAHALIEMYKHAGQEWFHVRDIEDRWRSHDHQCLQYWDLIEEAKEKREDGGRAGWWRVTELGERFALKEVRVPARVRVYDKHVLEKLGEPISIVDALSTHFNYTELMEG